MKITITTNIEEHKVDVAIGDTVALTNKGDARPYMLVHIISPDEISIRANPFSKMSEQEYREFLEKEPIWDAIENSDA